MREARVCYDHLAGDRAVAMFDGFVERGILVQDGGAVRLGPNGAGFFTAVGIDAQALHGQRRPTCRACLDWSVRRSHLAGSLGAAIFDKIVAEKWARREPGARTVTFSPKGRQAFERIFVEG